MDKRYILKYKYAYEHVFVVGAYCSYGQPHGQGWYWGYGVKAINQKHNIIPLINEAFLNNLV